MIAMVNIKGNVLPKLITGTVGPVLIYNNSPERELRSSPDLDPDLGYLQSHIVVNVSLTSNIIPSFIKIGQSRFFWQTLKSRDSITRRKFKNPAQEILDILV